MRLQGYADAFVNRGGLPIYQLPLPSLEKEDSYDE